MMGECEKLYVKLFGHFEVRYKDDNVKLGRGSAGKNLRLFQILAAYSREGISRTQLMDCLFGDEEVSDRGNSLRVIMHRLKKQLVKAGVGEGECFLLEDGIYTWSPDMPLETDVHLFTGYLEQAKQEQDLSKKTELLMAACDIYDGDFLEDIGAEQWAVVRAVEYKGWYMNAVRQLLDLLREQKRYDQMLQVSGQASRIYPYDEWQVDQIESLMALKRVKEAIQLYRQTVRRYYDDLGIELPRSMAAKIKQMNDQFKDTPDIMDDIRNQLEESERGAGCIYLSPPSFIDTFRLMVRIAERNHQDMCLMVCILKEDGGSGITDEERMERMSDSLKEAINASLRRGDSYTHYDRGQFLILLVGTKVEMCDMIFQRIHGAFRRRSKAWEGTLSYYATAVDKMERSDVKVHLRKNRFDIDDSI